MEEYRPGEWQSHINTLPITLKVIRYHQEKSWQNWGGSSLGGQEKIEIWFYINIVRYYEEAYAY